MDYISNELRRVKFIYWCLFCAGFFLIWYASNVLVSFGALAIVTGLFYYQIVAAWLNPSIRLIVTLDPHWEAIARHLVPELSSKSDEDLWKYFHEHYLDNPDFRIDREKSFYKRPLSFTHYYHRQGGLHLVWSATEQRMLDEARILGTMFFKPGNTLSFPGTNKDPLTDCFYFSSYGINHGSQGAYFEEMFGKNLVSLPFLEILDAFGQIYINDSFFLIPRKLRTVGRALKTTLDKKGFEYQCSANEPGLDVLWNNLDNDTQADLRDSGIRTILNRQHCFKHKLCSFHIFVNFSS